VRHDATSADDRCAAYRDAFKNDHVASNPHVVFNANRLFVEIDVEGVASRDDLEILSMALAGVQRMGVAVKDTGVVSNKDAIANAQPHRRPQFRVVADIAIAPHGDLSAVTEGEQLPPDVRASPDSDAAAFLAVFC